MERGDGSTEGKSELETALIHDRFGAAIEDDAHASPDLEAMFLVFVARDGLFAVRAERVESVVPWRDPVTLPGSKGLVRGVIQDRGRVIAVLRHPDGTEPSGSGDASRVLICPTPLGFLGLPATRTFAVAAITTARGLEPLAVLDTEHGPATYLEPDELAARVAADG
jgi:chemotaxis signal transduction protein